MRAWQVQRLGDPDQALQLAEVDEPRPEPGEVVIGVRAAALNFFDILLCRGEYQERPVLPFTPGGEISDTVLDAGEDATLPIGQVAIATPPLPRGGYADKVAVPEGSVFPVPGPMPFEKAAALPITYQMAYVALHHRAQLASGETVLVHVGAGGVGSAVIQLAKAAGARVIATAGGPEKVGVLREARRGDSRGLSGGELRRGRRGGYGGPRRRRDLRPGGRRRFRRFSEVCRFRRPNRGHRFLRRKDRRGPTNHVLVKNYSLVGMHWGLYTRVMPDLVHGTHEVLVDRYEAGEIDPLISETVPFEQLPAALKLLGGRGTYGKIVLRPAG